MLIKTVTSNVSMMHMTMEVDQCHIRNEKNKIKINIEDLRQYTIILLLIYFVVTVHYICRSKLAILYDWISYTF